MNRLLRAGFSSRAIYKVLREWELPAEAVEGLEAGGAEVGGAAEPEERAGIRMLMRGRMRGSDG